MLCVTAVSGETAGARQLGLLQTAPEPALLVWHQHQSVPENWPSSHNSLPFVEHLAEQLTIFKRAPRELREALALCWRWCWLFKDDLHKAAADTHTHTHTPLIHHLPTRSVPTPLPPTARIWFPARPFLVSSSLSPLFLPLLERWVLFLKLAQTNLKHYIPLLFR